MSNAFQPTDAPSIEVRDRISRATLPTQGTLRRRQSIPNQIFKAAKFSYGIIRVLASGH